MNHYVIGRMFERMGSTRNVVYKSFLDKENLVQYILFDYLIFRN